MVKGNLVHSCLFFILVHCRSFCYPFHNCKGGEVERVWVRIVTCAKNYLKKSGLHARNC